MASPLPILQAEVLPEARTPLTNLALSIFYICNCLRRCFAPQTTFHPTPSANFSQLLLKSMMTENNDRRTGPRAMLKNQRCREIAEQMMREKEQEVRENQNDSKAERLESISRSSQISASGKSCLDVSSENDLKDLARNQQRGAEAVTYWSHEFTSNQAHFPVTPLNQGSSLFAMCTSFSKDTEDWSKHN